MNSQKLLLIIGVLGVVTSIIGIIRDINFTTNLIACISGICLIHGYFELKKLKDEQTKES